MSNLIIALAVLVAAGTVVLQQGKSLASLRSQNEQLSSQHLVLRERLAKLQERGADLNRCLKTTQEELSAFNHEQAPATWLASELSVPPDATRQGGWPDRAPFFYLPKRHLSSVGYPLLDGDRLTDDAVALFGMNSAEREAVDTAYNALWQKFRDLEIQRLVRVEQPEKWKNMLNSISYRIPALEEEASALRADFQSAVVQAVGSTRDQYLMEAFNGFLASKLEDLGQHARVISFGYVGQPNGKMQPMYGIVDETAGTAHARTFDQLEEDWPISYYARLFGVNVPIRPLSESKSQVLAHNRCFRNKRFPAAARRIHCYRLGRNFSNTMKTMLMIVLASVAILAGGCATSHSHTTDWEYKVVSGKFNLPLEQEINKAAADGWVLVSAGGQTDAYGFAVLKRHKKSQ